MQWTKSRNNLIANRGRYTQMRTMAWVQQDDTQCKKDLSYDNMQPTSEKTKPKFK